ncbi:MAG: bacillithiol biosynthesis deacetylase BshB1 [Bdellovibrionales bacterium]|nr:bacillithiol biosynthesis deacetylase BshB1 [Bdellovibrionales bacterium]
MSVDCMVIASHPDDAEIGMGGTIAALVASGKSVLLVDLTDGEPTPFGSAEIRATESQAASAVLGLTQRINLGLTNRELFDGVESRKRLAELMREYRPKVLFTQYWDDAHPDHIQAAALSIASRFYSKFVKSDMKGEAFYPGKVFYYFSTHMRVRQEPSFVYDISEYFQKKIEALKCYHSQFTANPKNQVVFEMLQTENAYWGMQAGARYGEPFVCKEILKASNGDIFFNG